MTGIIMSEAAEAKAQLLKLSCIASPPGQTAFLWMIFTLGIVWWAWPIISNITKGRRTIINAISWYCARACQPHAVCYFALKASRTHEERLILYFNGMPIHGAKEGQESLSSKMIICHLLSQLFSLYPFIFGVFNKFFICGQEDATMELTRLLAKNALQFWYFHSVPAAIIGAAALLAACLKATHRTRNTPDTLTPVPVIAYSLMCLWFGAYSKIGGFLTFGGSILYRYAPIAVIAFGWGYYPYPWPQLERWPYGVLLLLMGFVSTAFAWYAFAMKGGPMELLKERQREKADARQAMIDAEAQRVVSRDEEEGVVMDKYGQAPTTEVREVREV
ncbi:hypothetical protein HYFRA_00012384 [Hymenoscyphus fraxineus]|uniref:Uncharacterized protein n=1 Tax=Hymenoscyphus fraxineus TaxID=746836 RepID=A0A9N9L4S0_9HELO|nr:hypothetical protein HYFRA_00012384 [Hymenoscyphus fraxineus]